MKRTLTARGKHWSLNNGKQRLWMFEVWKMPIYIYRVPFISTRISPFLRCVQCCLFRTLLFFRVFGLIVYRNVFFCMVAQHTHAIQAHANNIISIVCTNFIVLILIYMAFLNLSLSVGMNQDLIYESNKFGILM